MEPTGACGCFPLEGESNHIKSRGFLFTLTPEAGGGERGVYAVQIGGVVV